MLLRSRLPAAAIAVLLGSALRSIAESASDPSFSSERRPQTASASAFSIGPLASADSAVLWFCALCACAVAMLVWQLYKARIDRVALQTKSRVAGILEERERIARELHDTLIQSVYGLILTLQSSTTRPSSMQELRRQIGSALDLAGDLLDEARDRVSALRASVVPLDLARAISHSADSLSVARRAKFKLVVKGNPQPLQPTAAEQIHGIAREALANAFAHAEAKQI